MSPFQSFELVALLVGFSTGNPPKTLRAQKIEKIQSRLKSSISLEMFNPDLQNFPPKIGVW